jgi:hypothetical protein
MYISIYTIGAIFPALLFPTSYIRGVRYLTWAFAIIEWTVCFGCIIHGVFVARRLARERRNNRQVEEDAVFAESLYQDEERAAREGELVLIDEEAIFEESAAAEGQLEVDGLVPTDDLITVNEPSSAVDEAVGDIPDATSSDN